MCEHLTNNTEVEELKNIFKKIDVNSDGTLDVEEVTRSLREIGFPDPETQAEQIFKITDLDNSGGLDLNEFISATIEKARLLTTERL